MEEVLKKKRGRKKSRRGAALALAVCLLALSAGTAILIRRRTETAEMPEKHESSGTLIQEAPEEILRVTVSEKNREPWTMERNGEGTFQLTGEQDWTVDPMMSDRITDALAHLEYAEILTENREEYEGRLAEFGLDEPEVAVEWETADGKSHALRIGSALMPGENDSYFMLLEGEDRLFAVDAGTMQDLSADRTLLHAVPDLPIRKALLDGIFLRNAEGETVLGWELNGTITDQDAGVNWRMTAPIRYAADEELMENLRESAENLGLGAYVGEATEDHLTACGLSAPRLSLSFHMAAGSTGTVTESGVYDVSDWEEETVTLLIGNERDEMSVFVQYGEAIYTVTAFALNPFLEADPIGMAARYPAVTPLNSLISLTVQKEDGEEITYEIARETSEEGENVLCLKNGEEIDWNAFEAAYNRMLVVSVSGTLPQGAEWGKTHTKYTFRTVSGRTHTVELSDFDGMHDAVTLDGETLFYLIRGGMTELP